MNGKSVKNIVILIGSPRKNGNTSALSNLLIDNLDKANCDVDVFFLYDYLIEPCIDCRACKKGTLSCKVDDDMQNIYTKLDYADIIIFGTPIYWFGPSAKTKLVLDRLRPYYGNKLLKNKNGALLLAAGEGEKDCDLTIEMFKRSFAALGMEFLGTAVSKSYDMGEAEKDTSAINAISVLADTINKM